MTNIDIIAMAREAGAWSQQSKNCDVEYVMSGESLGRFAALIAATAKAEEREACAKAAQDFLTSGRSPLGRSVADAIRARGETK